MLNSFGHGVDDLRIDDTTNRFVYPPQVQEKMDAIENGRLAMFSRVSPTDIGMVVTMQDLSEPALNGKEFRTVKVFPEEDKILIDVTPDKWPAAQVRYVKVPAYKRSYAYLPPTGGGFCFRTCMHASNRERAFAAAGFDPVDVECLAVRPHPDVEYGRVWRDVPKLCDKLNRERAPGHPFTVEFGFQIFSEVPDSTASALLKGADDVEFESLYTSEPYVILRNCSGCGLDVAPDLFAGGAREQCAHKLFVKDKTISYDAWAKMTAFALAGHGWMSTDDDLDESGSDPSPKGIMCHPFADSGMTLSNRKNMALQTKLIGIRHRIVSGGGIMLSHGLALQLAGKHDDATGCAFYMREDTGTVCACCYMHITEEEAKSCGGCGNAQYCSRSCQLWHWKEHKTQCASKEERERRRVVAEEARAARDAQLRRHDERETLARAEEVQKEAERKAQVARSRAERAEKYAANLADCIRRAAPRSQTAPATKSNKKKSKKERSTEEQLVHAAWNSTEERTARTAAFVAKQESEHAEAEVRKAKERVDRLKKLEADASAAHEAATHCVPCAPTIGDAIESAVAAR
jgi:hypothetical protein